MIEDIVKYDLLVVLLTGSVFLTSMLVNETIKIVKEIKGTNNKNKKKEN